MLECSECACNWEAEEDLQQGEIVLCPDCGLELEVVGMNPVQLAPAPEEEEDWGE